MLTRCPADHSLVYGSTQHENLLFDTLAQATGNVKLPVKPPDPIKSWDDLSCKDFCVREFDGPQRCSKHFKKKPKKPIYATLRVSDDCARDALPVSDLAKVLPSHLQLKKLHLQSHRTNPNPMFWVNVPVHTTDCHTDPCNIYLHVIEGMKVVFLFRSQEDVPSKHDGNEKMTIFPDFNPVELYLKGHVKKLAEKHNCTVHRVGAGMGILLPCGVSHCVHSFEETISITLSVDGRLRPGVDEIAHDSLK